MVSVVRLAMYLAMSRQADREGYPEIAGLSATLLREAEHASKFAELLGDVVGNTRTNDQETYVCPSRGARADKMRIAKRAKEPNPMPFMTQCMRWLGRGPPWCRDYRSLERYFEKSKPRYSLLRKFLNL